MEASITLSFNLSEMSKEQAEALTQAEDALRRAGVTFDTGQGMGRRDWFLDWSLKGPVLAREHA